MSLFQDEVRRWQPILIVQPGQDNPISNFYYDLKKTLAQIDPGCFNCEFKDGFCRTHPKPPSRPDCRPGYGSCCADCFSNQGYLGGHGCPLITDSQTLALYEQHFKPNDGFRTPNGCSLPREVRSFTCQAHCCGNGMTQESNDQMKAITDQAWKLYEAVTGQPRWRMRYSRIRNFWSPFQKKNLPKDIIRIPKKKKVHLLRCSYNKSKGGKHESGQSEKFGVQPHILRDEPPIPSWGTAFRGTGPENSI